MGFQDIDWYRIQSAAFTRIRVDFPIATLEKLAGEGNETPVNGDELADMKRGRRRMKQQLDLLYHLNRGKL